MYPEDYGIVTLPKPLQSLTLPLPRAGRPGAFVLGFAALWCAASLVLHRPTTPEPARLRIENGDSIARLFARASLSDGDLLAVTEAHRGAAFGLAFVPGEEVRIARREDGRLGRLIIGNGDGKATAFIADNGDRFRIATLPAPAAEGNPATSVTVGPQKHSLAAAGSALAAAGSEGVPGETTADPPANAFVVADDSESPDVRSPALVAAHSEDPSPGEEMERVEVRDGDSLYLIFNRNRLPQTDLQHLLASGSEGKKLERLRPGQSISFLRGPNGQLSRFHHEVDELTTVQFVRSGGEFTPRVVTRDYDRHIAVRSGVIRSSLFAAADGVPDQAVHQFVEVLEWDIDFARDLRRGDSFSLLYEELHIDGRRVRTGDVLALEFRSQRAGEPIRAFRYTDSNGNTDYFTPEGRSLRRAFMRNPLRFTRISSRFSRSRLHPVLRIKRPHRGVDYAAPRGTAVRATGSGRVSFAGRKGGYGKTVMLAHGNGYTTVYAHLSRYAKGVRKGKGVRQGQLIGYVGSTGISTGPHLHYEFRINGVHRDPLSVELPRAAPLDKKEMKRFRREIGEHVARLDRLGATQLASLDR